MTRSIDYKKYGMYPEHAAETAEKMATELGLQNLNANEILNVTTDDVIKAVLNNKLHLSDQNFEDPST